MLGLTRVLTILSICPKSIFVNAVLETTSPSETTTTVDLPATFKCRTTSPIERIRWQFKSPSSKTPVIIHTGRQLLGQSNDKFAEFFDIKKQESFLVLKRVEVTDAGTFSCLETNSTSQRIDFVLRIDNRPVDRGRVVTGVDPATSGDADHDDDSELKRQSATVDNSVKTIAIAGVAGVLLFCGLIVVILVLLVMKFRQTPTSHNEVVITGRHRASHGHHHKHRHQAAPDSTTESQPEDFSDSLTSPTGSSSPSVDGHYSEIMEPETSIPAAATSPSDADPVSFELPSSVTAGQYQGLDPVAVVQLSTRPPNVYVNLTH